MEDADANLAALVAVANTQVSDWVTVDCHDWQSLYAWQTVPLYDAFGEVVGEIKADTIYLQRASPCPEQDLFHELGHAIARRFDLIGNHSNGFLGAWEQRQFRMVGAVRHQRHWSRLLDRVRRSAPPYTPDLCSEIWAELFMCWHLFPERREVTFIEPEMHRLSAQPELRSVEKLARILFTPATRGRYLS